MLKHLKAKLVLLAPFIIGYALIDAWSQTVFSTSFFAQTTPSDQIVKSLLAPVPALILLLLSGRIRLLVRRRYREVIYFFGVFAFTGTGLLLFIMYGSLDAFWIKIALSILVIARVCLIVCWWERLTVFSLQDMWLALGCAIVFGTFFNIVFAFTPEILGNCLIAAAPLVSTILLPVRGDRECEVGTTALSLSKADLSLRKMLRAIPWMLVIVLGLVNIPSEALVYLEMIGDLGDPVNSSLFASALTRMFVNLVALLLAYFVVRVNIGLTFFIAVPVVIIASFSLALGVNIPFSILHTICRIGSEMVRYVIVYLLFYSVVKRHVPALFCFSFMTFVHYMGSAFGVIAAFELAFNSTITAMLFMSILLVAMLFVIAEMQRHGSLAAYRRDFMQGNSREDDGAENSINASSTTIGEGENLSSDTSAAKASNDFASVELAFAKRYGLTQREREILSLWVKGHTAAYIEENLCISKHTVKTHVSHIYEKTETNSKEALILLTEDFYASR